MGRISEPRKSEQWTLFVLTSPEVAKSRFSNLLGNWLKQMEITKRNGNSLVLLSSSKLKIKRQCDPQKKLKRWLPFLCKKTKNW